MTPLPIDDPDDPRLAAYTRMRERDLVGRERRFIAEGEVVLRVLLSGHARFRIESVLLAPERWPGLAPALAGLDAPVYLAAKGVMGAVAGFPIHRGVLAVGLRGEEPPPDALVPPGPALLVGLVGLANHDNVGGSSATPPPSAPTRCSSTPGPAIRSTARRSGSRPGRASPFPSAGSPPATTCWISARAMR